jgi:hypothetical protein
MVLSEHLPGEIEENPSQDSQLPGRISNRNRSVNLRTSMFGQRKLLLN